MNDFFANLHWRMPVQSTPSSRWTSWARSLSSARRRIYSRHRVAVMQLLRPAIPIYRSSHRWELTAWSLFPRINLAVGPILQQSRRATGGVTREMRQEFLTSFKSRVERLIQTSHIAAAKATEPGRVTAGKAIRTEAVPATAYSFNEPLQRVFRR